MCAYRFMLNRLLMKSSLFNHCLLRIIFICSLFFYLAFLHFFIFLFSQVSFAHITHLSLLLVFYSFSYVSYSLFYFVLFSFGICHFFGIHRPKCYFLCFVLCFVCILFVLNLNFSFPLSFLFLS